MNKLFASVANGSKRYACIPPLLLVIISIVNRLTWAILPSDAWVSALQPGSRCSLPLSGAAGYSHPPFTPNWRTNVMLILPSDHRTLVFVGPSNPFAIDEDLSQLLPLCFEKPITPLKILTLTMHRIFLAWTFQSITEISSIIYDKNYYLEIKFHLPSKNKKYLNS